VTSVRNTLRLATLVAATAAFAPAQTPTKVAIINVQGAIVATKDGAKARDAIREKYEPRAKQIEALNNEIQKLRNQLATLANTASQETRDKISREIDDKQKKLQWDSEDLQNELQQEEGRLVNEIGQRMMQIIDEYAKAQGFALVLDVSSQQSPVVWAANGIDITQQIVELYDKRYGAGEASAAKPAAPAAKPAAGSPSAPAPAAAPKKPAGVK
jgi:outer membrane protein